MSITYPSQAVGGGSSAASHTTSTSIVLAAGEKLVVQVTYPGTGNTTTSVTFNTGSPQSLTVMSGGTRNAGTGSTANRCEVWELVGGTAGTATVTVVHSATAICAINATTVAGAIAGAGWRDACVVNSDSNSTAPFINITSEAGDAAFACFSHRDTSKAFTVDAGLTTVSTKTSGAGTSHARAVMVVEAGATSTSPSADLNPIGSWAAVGFNINADVVALVADPASATVSSADATIGLGAVAMAADAASATLSAPTAELNKGPVSMAAAAAALAPAAPVATIGGTLSIAALAAALVLSASAATLDLTFVGYLQPERLGLHAFTGSAAAQTVTETDTVPSGTDYSFLFTAVHRSSSAQDIVGVTLGGVSATRVAFVGGVNGIPRVECWRVNGVASGSRQWAISYTSGTTFGGRRYVALHYSGVNQTNPIVTGTGDSGNTTTPSSAAFTCPPEAVPVGWFAISTAGRTHTEGGNQTTLNAGDSISTGSTQKFCVLSTDPDTGSVAFSWALTGSADEWRSLAFGIRGIDTGLIAASGASLAVSAPLAGLGGLVTVSASSAALSVHGADASLGLAQKELRKRVYRAPIGALVQVANAARRARRTAYLAGGLVLFSASEPPIVLASTSATLQPMAGDAAMLAEPLAMAALPASLDSVAADATTLAAGTIAMLAVPSALSAEAGDGTIGRDLILIAADPAALTVTAYDAEIVLGTAFVEALAATLSVEGTDAAIVIGSTSMLADAAALAVAIEPEFELDIGELILETPAAALSVVAADATLLSAISGGTYLNPLFVTAQLLPYFDVTGSLRPFFNVRGTMTRIG
jgi:hypothetical protein